VSQETTIYLVNLIIGVILAALMTQHWRRDGAEHGLSYWAAAAWLLAIADVLFAVRPLLPHWASRFFPTLMVTLGHGVLLLAAQRTAGRQVAWRTVGTVALVHAVALGSFLAFALPSEWRTVVNGLAWGGLSLATAAALRSGPASIRQTYLVPTLVMLWQAVFHVVRTLAAVRSATQPDSVLLPLLQLFGDLEVSLFMVALFVSVLVAHLSEVNAQLRDAMGDIRQLSSLLRICAWCNKVRTDAGEWERLEKYLVQRRIEVSHAMCGDCATKMEDQVEAIRGPGGKRRDSP